MPDSADWEFGEFVKGFTNSVIYLYGLESFCASGNGASFLRNISECRPPYGAARRNACAMLAATARPTRPPMSDALLDREGIEALIPHREPFIFVDRIVELEYGQRAVGIMDDVGTHHEHVLSGHFPGFPVLPGAIIVEAVAEVGGVAALGMPENSGKIAMLTGLDKWKFRHPARPGDELRLEAEVIRYRRGFGRAAGRASIDGKLCASGEISFAIVDRPEGL